MTVVKASVLDVVVTRSDVTMFVDGSLVVGGVVIATILEPSLVKHQWKQMCYKYHL